MHTIILILLFKPLGLFWGIPSYIIGTSSGHIRNLLSTSLAGYAPIRICHAGHAIAHLGLSELLSGLEVPFCLVCRTHCFYVSLPCLLLDFHVDEIIDASARAETLHYMYHCSYPKCIAKSFEINYP